MRGSLAGLLLCAQGCLFVPEDTSLTIEIREIGPEVYATEDLCDVAEAHCYDDQRLFRDGEEVQVLLFVEEQLVAQRRATLTPTAAMMIDDALAGLATVDDPLVVDPSCVSASDEPVERVRIGDAVLEGRESCLPQEVQDLRFVLRDVLTSQTRCLDGGTVEIWHGCH